MIAYLRYNPVTGKNVEQGLSTVPLDVQASVDNNECVEIPDNTMQYFYDLETEMPLPKQLLSISHPTNGLINTDITISNVPNPCDVTWPDGEITTVTDGEVILNVDLAGEYTFKFNSIPHIIDDVTIEVTE